MREAWRLVGWAATFGCALSVTSEAATPNPPASKAAIQSWVFDGAFQAAALYGVATTDSGLVTFLRNGLVCSEGESHPTGFRSLSPAQSGVYAADGPLGFPLELSPSFVLQPQPPPIDPSIVENACVALQHESGVQSYIAGLKDQIDGTAAEAEACLASVKQLACDVLDLVPAAVAKCGPGPSELCPGAVSLAFVFDAVTEPLPKDPGPGYTPFEWPCFNCSVALSGQSVAVQDAARGLAACQKEAGELVSRRDGLVAFLASQGQPPSDFGLTNNVGSLDLGASASVDRATEAVAQVAAAQDEFIELSGACSHESLVEGCEACDGSSGPPPQPPVTGIVKSQQSARHVRKLAAAFAAESRRTTDRALQDRYKALAARLRGMPDARVLDLTAPAGLPFSQSFVALRRPDQPDDRRSPVAVVLTFVRSRRCPPPLNRADRMLVDDALEAFRRALDPGRACATCPPPR